MSTVSTNHCKSIENLMFFNSIDIVALITGKRSSTTSVSHPPEVEFIVITCTFQRKLFIFLKLELFDKGVEVFDSIVLDVHVGKAQVTVEL